MFCRYSLTGFQGPDELRLLAEPGQKRLDFESGAVRRRLRDHADDTIVHRRHAGDWAHVRASVRTSVRTCVCACVRACVSQWRIDSEQCAFIPAAPRHAPLTRPPPPRCAPYTHPPVATRPLRTHPATTCPLGLCRAADNWEINGRSGWHTLHAFLASYPK